MINQFLSEIQALSSLRHPNIISLYDVFATDEKIYIIMELMSGGELFDYVVKRGTLNEAEASHIIRMVTSALVYIHSERLVHRDLKPENLMLTHSPIIDKHSLNNNHDHDKDIQVKIIDFGLSKRMHEPLATTFLGTKGYLAPEMLQRRQYSEAVDCWSLGIICFVLLCGCLPFDDDPTTVPSDDIIKSRFILRFPRWAKDLSPSAKDLLRHLLDVNPKSRYTALQALNHPWVAGKTASETKLLASPGKIHLTPNQYRKNRIHNNFGPNTDYDNNNNNNAPTSNIQKYLKPTAAISSDQGDDRDNEGNSAITNRQYMNQIMADRAKGNAFHQNTRQQQPHRQLVRKLSI
jgi:serine/threonine protein kinase